MPGPPQIYIAYAPFPRWVTIQWVLPDDATGVAVFRSPPPPATWPTGWISRDSITDQSCEPRTRYTYSVCAYYDDSPDGECAPVEVWTPPVPPTPPPPVTTPAAVINPQASMNGIYMVFLSWGEITDPNTVKLKIFRTGPDGRLLRYTDPPDPQPGPADRFAAMYWDLITVLNADYRYEFTTYNRNGESTTVGIGIHVPAPPSMPPLPGWKQQQEIPHAVLTNPGRIAVASWAPDRIDVFVVNWRKPDGSVGVQPRIEHAVGKPESWAAAPMYIPLPNNAAGIAASSEQAGALDVFYTSNDNQLWHLKWTPGAGLPEDSNDTAWGAPESLGGPVPATLAAVSLRPGRTEVFYPTQDGMLGRRSRVDGQWQAEQKIPASIVGQPAVVSPNPARIDVCYRTPADRLAHRASTDDGRTWLPEVDVGGSVGTDPTAAPWATNSFTVYYVPPSSLTLHSRTWRDGRWYDEGTETAPHTWPPQPPFQQDPIQVYYTAAVVRAQGIQQYLFYRSDVPILQYRHYK